MGRPGEIHIFLKGTKSSCDAIMRHGAYQVQSTLGSTNYTFSTQARSTTEGISQYLVIAIDTQGYDPFQAWQHCAIQLHEYLQFIQKADIVRIVTLGPYCNEFANYINAITEEKAFAFALTPADTPHAKNQWMPGTMRLDDQAVDSQLVQKLIDEPDHMIHMAKINKLRWLAKRCSQTSYGQHLQYKLKCNQEHGLYHFSYEELTHRLAKACKKINQLPQKMRKETRLNTDLIPKMFFENLKEGTNDENLRTLITDIDMFCDAIDAMCLSEINQMAKNTLKQISLTEPNDTVITDQIATINFMRNIFDTLNQPSLEQDTNGEPVAEAIEAYHLALMLAKIKAKPYKKSYVSVNRSIIALNQLLCVFKTTRCPQTMETALQQFYQATVACSYRQLALKVIAAVLLVVGVCAIVAGSGGSAIPIVGTLLADTSFAFQMGLLGGGVISAGLGMCSFFSSKPSSIQKHGSELHKLVKEQLASIKAMDAPKP